MATAHALKEFASAISGYCEKRLSKEGFAGESKYILSRAFGPLTHLICFQTGTTSLKGSFTVSFGWRFDFDAFPRDRAVMDYWNRIGIAECGKDRWFPYETHLEQSIAEVAGLIDAHALGKLNRRKSVKAVIDEFDASGGKRTELVGSPLTLGLAYAHLGRNEEARRALEAVIERKGMPAWFREHRKIARQAICQIEESG